jgi:hypothetical protein
MSAPAENASNANYRTAFTSVSLGTEQELHGAVVRMKKADPDLIGVVCAESSPQSVLVEITKDMLQSDDKTIGNFTIELRTTPCELSAKTEWDLRTKALEAVISSISGRKGRPLADDTYTGYQIVISNKDQPIYSDDQIMDADRQATVGVFAAEIGNPIHGANRTARTLHHHLDVPWYVDRFAEDPEVFNVSEREQVGYALVMSAILKLATIWCDHGSNSVNNVNVKNAWVVRPRTPPIKILDTFSSSEIAAAVREQIKNRELPSWVNQEQGPTRSNWSDARTHILDAKSMGGHQPPAATINGQPAMLFEYRTAPDRYEDAFWAYGKWNLSSW